MKTYKLSEAIKMLEGNPKLGFRLKRDSETTLYVSGNHFFMDSILDEIKLEDIWVLVPQEVSFIDAVKAYDEGKKIYSKSRCCTFSYDCNGEFKDKNGLAITTDEILECKWYIGEPND